MTYVVTDQCIKCKYMDCVEVCPVDCFYEGANMLVISPDECIDCGVCEPECPVEAILPDTEDDAEKSWTHARRLHWTAGNDRLGLRILVKTVMLATKSVRQHSESDAT